MGRHAVEVGGGRPTGISLPLVTIGLQLLAIVGIGIWWSSTRQGGTPSQQFVVVVAVVSVLALIATIGLMVSRRDTRREVLPAGVTVAQLQAGDHGSSPAVLFRGTVGTGVGPENIDDVNPEVTSRIAMAGFPVVPPRPFRLSEIALHDDLFTHRASDSPEK